MHLDKQMTDLKFNVAQLLREEVGARRNYTFTENALPLDDDMTLRQLDGKVRFTRTTTGVLADADAAGIVELPCIRCLNPAHQQLHIQFQDEFHSRIEVNTGMPLPKPDEEDPFFIDESHLLDLGEALREYALLEMPMQPLCRPDCKGLCPTCGADRNQGECGCVTDEDDDRFAVLKSLLND
ncbi:hypothetical protein SE17_05135 [Kouleothrix aurantiaca]|uniref:Metal-binding protein n=1 Tax=Kouleothrix aurantiaca TaxID=186479 RepID=A0A0P9D577_9CHLR|nr:hypothetical protein SE17_05135 [Kouleothrix aurantiaca]